MSKNPVVHFEMPAKDRKRVSEFYTKVFGWKMNQLGEDMGNYIVAHTAETDEHNMVKTPGTINGGFWETQESAPPHVVISVDDIHEAMKNVESAGGQLLEGMSGKGKIDDIPGIGKYVSFKDTEGNTVGMLQPTRMA
jgi:predicted enzyme related to lactoylglutathione lyase